MTGPANAPTLFSMMSSFAFCLIVMVLVAVCENLLCGRKRSRRRTTHT